MLRVNSGNQNVRTNRAQEGGSIWEKEEKLLGKYYRLKWTFKIFISKVRCAKYIHRAQDYDYL